MLQDSRMKRFGWLYLATTLAVNLSGCDAREDTRAADEEFVKRMAAEHKKDLPTPNLSAVVGGGVKSLNTATVHYATIGGKTISGYLAEPDGAVAHPPAVILIHEWWGLNDNLKRVADNLAARGFTALAVDLYEGASAETPEKARELMAAAASRTTALEDNLRQAYTFLSSKGAPKIGVAGWCFGGGWALKTALLFPEEIDALTIYYGHLVQDRKSLATLKMPILGIFAERDQGIPVSEVRQFESSLKALGKPAQIHIYSGVDHAFANPSGERYAPEAAADAWEKTLAFFQAHLL